MIASGEVLTWSKQCLIGFWPKIRKRKKEEKVLVARELDAWSWRLGGRVAGGPRVGCHRARGTEEIEAIPRLC